MRYRWVISPVVLYAGAPDDAPVRKPLAATLIDPSRGKPYQHSSVIAVGNWCLSLVAGNDFGPLLAHTQVLDLFEQDGGPELLALTPADLGWKNPLLTRLRNRLAAQGISTSGLTATTPLAVWLDRVAQAIEPTGHSTRQGVGPRG